MKIDSATWKQWVDLDLEGELGRDEKSRLEELSAPIARSAPSAGRWRRFAA